jgi:predicted esterase
MDAFRPTPESLSIPQRLDLLKASGGRHVPIYLIYGDSDTAVQKFEKTVDALKGVQGELEIEVREGADHAFDEVESEECLAFRDWVGRVLL